MPKKTGSKSKVTKRASKKTGTKIPTGVGMQGGFWNKTVASMRKANLQKTGNFSTTQTSSFFYSPELTTESWLLPKSRQEILKWARIFFNLEPYVQSVVMMHAYYPFSKFEITTSDDEITEFYKEMAFNEEFDLFKFILRASLSYQKFGEAIPFGTMEKDEDGIFKWKSFVLLEPELIEIKKDMFTGKSSFEMVPTEEMRALVKSNKAEDAERQEQLQNEAPEIIKAVNEGRNIKLDEENVSIITRDTDPSATRGTSPIQCLFKVLIYQDWIRLAQSAFAQRYIFPIELWKIGDLQHNIIPDDETLEKFRDIINQAVQNPPFSLVFPPIVSYEPLSTVGKNFPINNEYDYIIDQLLIGMGVNKNIILGEGPSFSNVKTMALHKLMMVYKVIREEFENWLIYKYFKPIAVKNGFYKVENGKRKLVLPQISWYKSLDVEEEEAERELAIQLHEKGFLSTETLYSKLPSIDYKAEQKKLEEEIGTVWDKGDDRLPGEFHKDSTGKRREKLSTPGEPGGGGVGATPTEPIEPKEPGEPTEPGEETETTETPGETMETTETTETTTTAPVPTTPTE